jgi:hypothetical protein
MILKGDPNAVWVVSDLNVNIAIQPGFIPKTPEELFDFSQCLNEFLILKGGTWSNFILFDSEGDEQCSLRYDFDTIEN